MMPLTIFKKCAYISLLAILVFNWCGYRILAFYLEEKAKASLQAKLDKDDYDHGELISIKIPSPNLPYYHSSKEFYNLEGEIEMNGVFYKFVKRRLYNDTLEFLCLPNKDAMNIYTAKNDFFKRVNELQQTDSGKKTQSHSANSKNPTGEYFFEHEPLDPQLFFPRSVKYISRNTATTSCFSPAPDKPPQHCWFLLLFFLNNLCWTHISAIYIR